MRPSILLAIAAVTVAACGGAPVAEAPPQATYPACLARPTPATFAYVGWKSDGPDPDPAALGGLLVVRYEGCETKLLAKCTAPGKYTYSGFPADRSSVHIATEAQLAEHLPSQAWLTPHLRPKGIDLATTLVGQYDADKKKVRRDELKGSCEGATHLVAAFKAGALDIVGDKRLKHMGEPSSCSKASREDTRPPAGCAELVHVLVTAIDEGPATLPPPGADGEK